MMNESQWNERRDAAYCELAQPDPDTARVELVQQFRRSTAESEKRFGLDPFAEIRDSRLKLKRDDTVPHATDQYLQKTINASLHQVRIEDPPHRGGSANGIQSALCATPTAPNSTA